jgi:hypothetical protein
VAIWAVLHFHFSLALLVLAWGRAMYPLLPLCACGMLQDAHLCARAAVARALVERRPGRDGAVEVCGAGRDGGRGLCGLSCRCKVASSLLWPCVMCCASGGERDDAL